MKKILLTTIAALALSQSAEAKTAAELRAEMMAMLQQQAEQEEARAKQIEEEHAKQEKIDAAARAKKEEESKEMAALSQRLQNVDSEEALQDIKKTIEKAIQDLERAQRGEGYADNNTQRVLDEVTKRVHEHKKATKKVIRTALEGLNNLAVIDYADIKREIREADKSSKKKNKKNNKKNN
jgi:hypothetical protein